MKASCLYLHTTEYEKYLEKQLITATTNFHDNVPGAVISTISTDEGRLSARWPPNLNNLGCKTTVHGEIWSLWNVCCYKYSLSPLSRCKFTFDLRAIILFCSGDMNNIPYCSTVHSECAELHPSLCLTVLNATSGVPNAHCFDTIITTTDTKWTLFLQARYQTDIMEALCRTSL